MDKVKQYKSIVRSVLLEQVGYDRPDHSVSTVPVFDEENGRYQLVMHGWRGERRIFGIVFHIEVHDDKVWIERDGLETGIARELLAQGIPKSDIVLGFHSPYMRQFMDFAVA